MTAGKNDLIRHMVLSTDGLRGHRIFTGLHLAEDA